MAHSVFIYHEFNDKKIYIKDYITRNGRFIVTASTQEQRFATNFKTKGFAHNFINHMNNPFDKKYLVQFVVESNQELKSITKKSI